MSACPWPACSVCSLVIAATAASSADQAYSTREIDGANNNRPKAAEASQTKRRCTRLRITSLPLGQLGSKPRHDATFHFMRAGAAQRRNVTTRCARAGQTSRLRLLRTADFPATRKSAMFPRAPRRRQAGGQTLFPLFGHECRQDADAVAERVELSRAW